MRMTQKIHPAVMDARHDLQRGKVSRREFLHLATLLGVSVTTAQALVAGQGQSQGTTKAIGGLVNKEIVRRGGTMRIGSAVQRVDHPARLAWVEAANQLRQVAEYLTETGPDNITRPWLLERWEPDEQVKTWTLYLRKGIRFNNGDELTADDLVFNFKQWLREDVGSSMRGLMSYLSPNNIELVDQYTVRLHLETPQIAVPEHLFHYPAMIMHRGFEGDFVKQPVGTGPFVLHEYAESERVVLRRRKGYWRKGADGESLPYLDELIYLDLAPDARVTAMQSGQIDAIYQPRPSDWLALKGHPGITVNSVSTAQTFVIRMRIDQEPWNDPKVRNALRLCQDRQKILRLAYSGQGDLGNDAHVAPVHPAYCNLVPAEYDPAQSRALLAAAGHPDGLKVRLTTKNDMAEPQIAAALKEMAKPGGFDIELDIVKPSSYWDRWTEVPLGITAWTHRPLATMVLALAYTSDQNGQPVPWNETRWVDDQFNTLLRQAERTVVVSDRRKIMCQIESIMQQRGPIGVPFWRKVWTISNSKFKNIEAHPTSYDLFYDVWKDA